MCMYLFFLSLLYVYIYIYIYLCSHTHAHTSCEGLAGGGLRGAAAPPKRRRRASARTYAVSTSVRCSKKTIKKQHEAGKNKISTQTTRTNTKAHVCPRQCRVAVPEHGSV